MKGAPTPEVRPIRSVVRWWSGLLLLAGLGLFVAILASSDLGAVLDACLGIGPDILLIMVAPLGYFVLHTWGWLLLITGQRPRFGRALRAYIASQALDELWGGLLGEPLKVFVVPGDDRTAGIGSVTLDNLALLASLAIFLLLGGGVLAWLDVEAISFGHLGVALLGLLGLGALLGVLLLLGPGLVGRRLASRFPGGVIAGFLERYREVARHNRIFLARHPGRFTGSIGLHVLAKIWVIFEVWLTLEIMGLYEPGRAIWLGLGKQAVQITGAPIPAQMGVFTGTLAFLGEALGIAASAALAVALLRRARSLVWIGVGLALIRGLGGSTPAERLARQARGSDSLRPRR